ncbi:MAG: HEAT repeat domain-containing protein [Planctomycetota bacterium]
MSTRWVVAALVVGGGAGFCLGSLGRCDAPSAEVRRSASVETVRAPIVASAPARAAQPGAVAPKAVAPVKPLSEVAAATAPHADEDGHDHPALSELDEKKLAKALTLFRESQSPDEIGELAGILGACGGERAAKAALSVLASAGSSPVELTRRAAAFQVLATQESPLARGPALDVLSRESDIDLRRAAISALGTSRRASPEEAATMTGQLSRLVETDADHEVRRRAVRALVRWRTSDAEIAPVLRALEHDPEPLVRGAAAFSLEDERIRSPEALAALNRVVANTNTPPSVRELAAEALSRLGPLDATTRQTLQRFDEGDHPSD